MSRILDEALARVKSLSSDRQDEVGEIVLTLVEQEASPLALTIAQQAEVRRRIATSDPTVPSEEMEAFFRSLTG